MVQIQKLKLIIILLILKILISLPMYSVNFQSPVVIRNDFKYLSNDKINYLVRLFKNHKDNKYYKYDKITEQLLLEIEGFENKIKEEYLSLDNDCKRIEFLYLLESFRITSVYYYDPEYMNLLSKNGSSYMYSSAGILYQGFDSLNFLESLQLDLRLRKKELLCN